MIDIRDYDGKLVGKADRVTGVVESKHGDRIMRVTLSEGESVTLLRPGTITNVIRTNGDFTVSRRKAA